jgi:hypothetical protein
MHPIEVGGGRGMLHEWRADTIRGVWGDDGQMDGWGWMDGDGWIDGWIMGGWELGKGRV